MPEWTCPACSAAGEPDRVPHEPWCALFMRELERDVKDDQTTIDQEEETMTRGRGGNYEQPPPSWGTDKDGFGPGGELEPWNETRELEETDTQKERRLEREARDCLMGVLGSPTSRNTCRVEVTYQREGELEHCGWFLVHVPEIYGDDGEPSQELEHHPATLATELVHASLEQRFPNAEYLSVDDTYAA